MSFDEDEADFLSRFHSGYQAPPASREFGWAAIYVDTVQDRVSMAICDGTTPVAAYKNSYTDTFQKRIVLALDRTRFHREEHGLKMGLVSEWFRNAGQRLALWMHADAFPAQINPDLIRAWTTLGTLSHVKLADLVVIGGARCEHAIAQGLLGDFDGLLSK